MSASAQEQNIKKGHDFFKRGRFLFGQCKIISGPDIREG